MIEVLAGIGGLYVIFGIGIVIESMVNKAFYKYADTTILKYVRAQIAKRKAITIRYI